MSSLAHMYLISEENLGIQNLIIPSKTSVILQIWKNVAPVAQVYTTSIK